MGPDRAGDSRDGQQKVQSPKSKVKDTGGKIQVDFGVARGQQNIPLS